MLLLKLKNGSMITSTHSTLNGIHLLLSPMVNSSNIKAYIPELFIKVRGKVCCFRRDFYGAPSAATSTTLNHFPGVEET
jgi:hypothetical protein